MWSGCVTSHLTVVPIARVWTDRIRKQVCLFTGKLDYLFSSVNLGIFHTGRIWVIDENAQIMSTLIHIYVTKNGYVF